MSDRLLTILLLLLFIMVSCGKSSEEKRDSAINEALIYLSDKECQKAIDVLEATGDHATHTLFLQTLSSAYGCKAGYGEPAFYGTNLIKLGVVAGSLLGGLATFTTSDMTSPVDDSYVDLQRAIDILLYAGGISVPSSANRSEHFDVLDLGDMNAQLLYMLFAQLGKYMQYYGNTNSSGKRGLGSGTNDCFFTYDVTTALAAALLGDNPCNIVGGDIGHPSLSTVAQAVKVKRMCQAVTLFNNLIDTLINTVTASSGTGDLSALVTSVQSDLAGKCGGNGLAAICTITSQSLCESDYGTDPGDINNDTGSNMLQIYFAAIFELLLT